MFKLLYKGRVRPLLEYAAPTWNPHLKSQIDAIEAVQRRATRMVPGLSDLPYQDRLRKLNIPTLAYRRVRGDMIQKYKLVCSPETGSYDKSLPPLFKFFSRDTRGNNKKIALEHVNRDIRKYNFNMKNAKIWNSLAQHIIDSKNIQQFEYNLDKYWSKQPLYFDEYKENIQIH